MGMVNQLIISQPLAQKLYESKDSWS